MVEGVRRGRIMAFEQRGEYLAVAVEVLPVKPADAEQLKEYMGKVLGLFEQYAKLSHHLAFEGLAASLKIDDPERFADTLSAHLAVATAEKQTLLEAESPYERLQKLQDLLEVEIEKVNIDRRINNKVKKQMEKAQKEYYLNEKIKAIHQELGRKDDRADEVEDLKKKIATLRHAEGSPREGRDQELKRLEAMPPVSAEATVSRNYIEWLVGVPWKKASRESKDISRAEKILNEDHYGLEKVKERILEFLAVRQLVQKTKGSIICFVGPPGVGKTSLAKSIARSLNRQVRPAVARRRAGRGGDPRPPPDLHRRVPRPDHPDDEEGGHGQPGVPARRGRQDVVGLPRRPGVGAARGAGSGAEPRPSWTTTSTSSTTSRRSCSSRRPTSPTRSRRP